MRRSVSALAITLVAFAGIFGIPSGRENELETGFTLAVERGAKSIAVWGMHGNAAWDGASENPEVVWDVVGKIFQVIRNKQ